MSDDAIRELGIPELSLVLLVGVSGSGKSSFARRAFGPYETLSSDYFRGLVADDESDQSATPAAFEALRAVASQRLKAGRLTVVDATNVRPDDRREWVRFAREHDVLPVAIVLDVPAGVAIARNAERADRSIPAAVVRRQAEAMRRSVRGLAREGFRRVHVLTDADQIAAVGIRRERLLTDARDETGPFDVIGDVHGCRGELESLLTELGWSIERDALGRAVDARHPEGRRAVFVGDLVDRGPDVPGVLRLVMGMVRSGAALSVQGNHEDKLARALEGKKVSTGHGLAETLAQLAGEPPEFRDEVAAFARGLLSHYVLDGGRLVVAHAGLPERYQGRASGRVRAFALYGDTTGETDEYGLPVRYPWAEDYRGAATVVYGHTPTVDPEWINRTICIDTGCVFGGRLTAVRYPERELVSVPAERVWCEPARPLAPATDATPATAPSTAQRRADAPTIDDVLGKRIVETAVLGPVTVREDAAAGALEVMSRWAIDPRWLVYLPPTMSPTNTAKRADVLEHPDEAFAFYREGGVLDVVGQEKHMGSRAIAVLARDAARFGVSGDRRGALYTRTGRPFLPAHEERAFLDRMHAAVDAIGLWDELGTSWIVLDGEALPWSLKAEDIIRDQYAAVGAAAGLALPRSVAALEAAAARGIDVSALLAATRERTDDAIRYADVVRRFGAPVPADGIRFAPFQLIAAEGGLLVERPHAWHLGVAERLAAAAPDLVRTTRSIDVRVDDPGSVEAGVAWWERLTANGAEGMVVKPAAGLVRRGRSIAQPGLKVRGREYLRLIYGPDYTRPDAIARLRDRGLGRKRGLAAREYALGLEAARRFAEGEPLWRVHEAVFGVLGLESEPVDPRL
ncbi:polynucleotide kinase-phosphatase [Galbitalea sp. SE-J8]|uniref:polynucleotide kinase-phosphatase n=1 Tax=Galbitalea sp. SE-J8 TaxID=3054952 RepID=UPI00259C9A5C|nr:polynucleotide kinase-phosphatase [Galbitalea sp. SE-J8]MDM4763649.1 polynucleotide kinase-phosphatase [Galbitalea sp. SE-J8]